MYSAELKRLPWQRRSQQRRHRRTNGIKLTVTCLLTLSTVTGKTCFQWQEVQSDGTHHPQRGDERGIGHHRGRSQPKGPYTSEQVEGADKAAVREAASVSRLTSQHPRACLTACHHQTRKARARACLPSWAKQLSKVSNNEQLLK